MDNVDEIKQKLDIVAVLNEYMPLKKAGVNWKARCPFHNEKTPSFFVNPERQTWHCFGCGEGGDIFSFIQKIEGLEFPEALRILAQKAGVALQKFDARVVSQKNRLYNLCDAAVQHWQANLASAAGVKVVAYLKKRQVTPAAQESFKLGYAQDSWDDLFNFLRSQNYTETEIFQAGLSVKKEKGSGYYDRFRDRLIFPIQDLQGQVVGCTARALKEGEPAKYINTPEGPIYHKSRVLYGLDKAKTAIREQGYAVLVEGNMDVIACHQAGFKNVVACSGTALTAEHIKILKRYTDNVMLCFDQDEAGQRAAQRSIDLLVAEELNLKIVQLISGKDPDECLKNNPQDWVASIKKARLVMEFYLEKYLAPANLSQINHKKAAVKALLAEIIKIPNRIERDHWLKELAKRLDISETVLRESLPGAIKPAVYKKESTTASVKAKSREQECLELIFTIVFSHPSLLSYAQENLAPEMLSDLAWRAFYQNLLLYFNERSAEVSARELADWLMQSTGSLDKVYLNSLLVKIDQSYEGFSLEQLHKELITLINQVKRLYLETKIKEWNRQLGQAERDQQKDLIRSLSREIQDASELLAKLK